jgi:hypothetical protein
MNTDRVSWLLGMTGPVWSPSDEGVGGGVTDGEAKGSDTGGEEGVKPSADTVLGAEPADDKPADAKAKDGEAETDKSDAKADDKSKDGEGDKKDDDKSKGADEVPEDGSYEFALPEGVELTDEDKTAWSNEFKEMGLTRGQADRLIAAQSARAVQEQKAYAEYLNTQQTTHLEAAKADKDIGGDKWAESARLSNLGLKALGGSAIKDLILSSGNGNNPEMIRELRRIGEMVKEDKFEAGTSHEAPVSKEKSWYGSTTPDSKKG